jgi:methylmalonyl-CoA mutase N-terminal domain/subunit
MILDAGGGGLSVAFDMPTLMGRDSDDPHALGEVGHCGVAIDSAADMDVLFDAIPLADVTTSMTISGRPCRSSACTCGGRAQGAICPNWTAPCRPDIFKEYIAQKEWLFAPEPHLRLIGDLMEFCDRRSRATSRCRCPGYHIREAGRRPRRSSRTRWPTGSATSSWACRAGWT